MTLNSGYNDENAMADLMKWLRPQIKNSFSRTLALKSNWESEHRLTIGYGYHFLWYNSRLFWFHLKRLDSPGAERQKDELTVSTLGRAHQPFHHIIDQIKKSNEGGIEVLKPDSEGNWYSFAYISPRPLKTLATSTSLKERMVEQIHHFKNHREWYYDRGLSYKISYLLHGNPGTGKTSLVLYPNYNFDDVEFQTMTGCDIHEAFLEGKESPQRFLSYLNR